MQHERELSSEEISRSCRNVSAAHALRLMRKGKVMKELLLPLGILVVWFVLNAWVLPRFGVNT